MKAQRRAGRLKVPGQKKLKDPIEDFIQLEDYAVFRNLDGSPGAAILRDGETFQFRFGFQIDGIHPTLSDEQMESVCMYIQDGFMALPEGESLTVIQHVYPDNSDRLRFYKKLIKRAPNPLFKAMIKSAASPGEYFPGLTKEEIVTKARLRYKKKKITLYVTCTPSQMSFVKDKTEQILTKIVDKFSKTWHKVIAEDGEFEADKIRQLFLGVQAIYEDWVNVLSKMRLNAVPMSAIDLVAEQWREFNDTPLRSVPQLIIWDGSSTRYQKDADQHVSSWFFDHQQSVPKALPNFVVQTRGYAAKYTGVLTLRNKPGGWRNHTDQIKYLYKIGDFLDEYKVVFTAKRAPQFLVTRNVELIQRQAKDAKLHAEKRNLPSTATDILQAEADKATAQLYSGNIPVKTSLCFLIAKSSKKQLLMASRKLQSQFLAPASVEIESDYTYLTWLQCFPQLSYKSPLFAPYDRTKIFMASTVAAFMPIVKVTSPDQKGLEFITEEESTPYYLDIADSHRHILFLAITRSGKSVLFAQILMIAMCSRIPMVIVDYPRETGDSTFGPITRLAGEQGAYLNIAEEANNILELPDLRGFPDEERDRRLIEVKDYVLDTLMIIMYGGNLTQIDREVRTCKSIFGNLIELFYAQPDIKSRFEASLDAPVGSSAWQDTPTLKEFAELCTKETLSKLISDISDEHIRLMGEIRLRLLSFMTTTVGKSMSKPTTIPKDANLLVFAFKGVSSNDDAAILMSSAAAAAMRRTLAAPVSILFLDEASILSKFESLMAQTAKIAANGAKSGIRLMMALQTPASIAKSSSGDEILANLATRLIGRVDGADIKNYSRILDIPESVIQINTQKSFYPVASELYSRWLVMDRGEYTFVRSYAPPLLLAAVANNPDEEMAKEAFLRKYKDPVLALKKFAIELILSFQENRPIQIPEVEVFENAQTLV